MKLIKKSQFQFIVIFITLFISIVSSHSIAEEAINSAADSSSFFDVSLWQNITVAALSGILIFVSGYVLAGIKRRQGSGKSLSYSLSIEKGLVMIEKEVKEKVQVLYDGEVIDNLYHIKCDVENTGITVIKSQDIRFEFTPDTRILDCSLEPTPQPEMKVEMIKEPSLKPCEVKYSIGHIEKNQSVGFRFTATSTKDIELDIHPFNENGDVNFVSKSIKKIDDEKEKNTKFITLLLLYFTLPQVFDIVGISLLSRSITGLIRLIILFFIFPLIVPFSESISNIISSFLHKKQSYPSKYIVNIKEGKDVNIGDIHKEIE